MPDLTVREWATVVPLIAAIFIIGVYPQPFLNATRIPADDLIQRVSRSRALRPRGAMLQQRSPESPERARTEDPG